MLDIDARISELETQIKSLKETKERLQALTPAEDLAIFLHDKLCTWNHTDGCEWHYEIKNGLPTWKSDAQKRYLHNACTAIRAMGSKPEEAAFQIKKIVTIIKS